MKNKTNDIMKLSSKALKTIKDMHSCVFLVNARKDLVIVKKQISLNSKVVKVLSTLTGSEIDSYMIKSDFIFESLALSHTRINDIKIHLEKEMNSLESSCNLLLKYEKTLQSNSETVKTLAELKKSSTRKSVDFLVNKILKAIYQDLGTYAETACFLKKNDGGELSDLRSKKVTS
jgi:uncharacterized protein with von Willebrand factor type A (vWA) domain